METSANLKIMETRSKVSGGSDPLKKAIGGDQMAVWTPKRSKLFLHARHRATDTKLGLRSSNAITNTLYTVESR